LQAVPGSGTRPITDRVKEAVFNILRDSIVNAQVLDLFAGTGSVGIEALSRGAEQAVFVEKHPKAIATIRTNLRRTALRTDAEVVKADVFKFLARTPQPFDLIYIAPPQYQALWSQTLLALDAAPGWLDPGGMVIVQIFPKEFEPLSLTNLRLSERRKYGSTLLCFYEALPE
jgi:16S rRNA (guanine(966)-N(2))-methyltransferase RsmD